MQHTHTRAHAQGVEEHAMRAPAGFLTDRGNILNVGKTLCSCLTDAVVSNVTALYKELFYDTTWHTSL